MKKTAACVVAFGLLVWLNAATVTKDVCYTKDAGTGQYTAASVAAVCADTWTWSDCETGAVTCTGTDVLLNVKADLVITDWIATSLTAWTTHYEMDDATTPTKVVRHGTLAHMLLDNDFTDEKGAYGWTENGTVPFDAVTVKEGTHAAGPMLASGGDYISSSSAISETAEVVQLYFNRGAIAWNGTHKRIWTDGSIYLAIAWDQLSIYNGSSLGWWTGVNASTWYHIACEFGGTGYGTKLLVNGIERKTGAQTGQPTNVTHYFGAHSDGTIECNCWIDTVRIMYELHDSYPTIGDY